MVSYDIKGAFLNAVFTDEDEPTYVVIRKEVAELWSQLDPTSEPYRNKKGEFLLALDKFAYGLKQSPIKFQQHLRKVLQNIGYVESQYDDCLYTKVTSHTFSIISTHVDDILQVSNCRLMTQELHQGLIDAYTTVTYNPNADSYLGMSITRNDDGHEIFFNQSGSIEKLLQEGISFHK